MIITTRQGRKIRVNQAFVLYLAALAFWQLTALVISFCQKSQTALFWYRLQTAGLGGQFIFYFFFIRAFLSQTRQRPLFYGGWISFFTLLGSSFTSWVIKDVTKSDFMYVPSFGPLVPLVGIVTYFFLFYSMYNLMHGYQRTRSSLHRNRIRYLLLGSAVIALGTISNIFSVLQAYPIDRAANVVNALLIAYAILRHQLLDITVVIRKGILYSIPTIIVSAVYFLIISSATRIFQALAGPQIFFISLIVAIFTAVLVQPQRDRLQNFIDRLFFREKYDANLMLQRFNRTAAQVLNFNTLPDLILDEVTNTMHATSVTFFLKKENSETFHLTSQRGLPPNTNFVIRSSHPVVTWFAQHDHALTRHDIDVKPQFKALWNTERQELASINATVFLPLKVKGALIGIFAVGKKRSGETYTQDDQLTLSALTNQIAVATENARLYWELEGALEALRTAHGELEVRVQERTAELAEVNTVLRSEIVERSRAEERIKASLKEKEILLKEIHHRVKNNLQVISSLLSLQAETTKDTQALAALRESRNRVHSMAVIHETLYQSKDLAQVDFATYTEKLVNHLQRSLHVNSQLVTLEINVNNVSLSIDTAIYCGLIINELISNSFKYAFPDGRVGKIVISLSMQENAGLSLEVCDNGVGISEDIDIAKTESLGLQLVTMLTEQLSGTLELDRHAGTRFKIMFKQ